MQITLVSTFHFQRLPKKESYLFLSLSGKRSLNVRKLVKLVSFIFISATYVFGVFFDVNSLK